MLFSFLRDVNQLLVHLLQWMRGCSMSLKKGNELICWFQCSIGWFWTYKNKNDDKRTCGTWNTWWYGDLKSYCMKTQLVLTCRILSLKLLVWLKKTIKINKQLFLWGGMVLQWKTFDYWFPFQNLQWFWIHCFGHCWSQYARCWRLYLSCFKPNGTSWNRCHSKGNFCC